MSKDMKSVNDMVDYVRQLRLHAAGRRSIHIRLSKLEKHLREEHYRRFVAMALRPLITNFGATMFALPTNDLVLVVKDAKIDHIDLLLNQVRLKFRESALLAGLDPVQGQSDAFVEWFDLEEDYAGFRAYIEALADSILAGSSEGTSNTDTTKLSDKPKSPGMLEIKSRPKETVSAPKRGVRMVPIEAPEKDIVSRELDPELIVALNKALLSADVGGMIQKQHVMAVLGTEKSPVMVHKFVPAALVFKKLLKTKVYGKDSWLDGYLDDLLACRVMFAVPNMENEGSIASSIHVSCAAVVDQIFDQFDQSLGAEPRSKIILEFGATDVMAHFGMYLKAISKTEPLGYRIMIGGLDPRALRWLDYENFEADFVKLSLPEEGFGDWLDKDMEWAMRDHVQKIGVARVILSGCNTQADIETGQRLGISLFQGEAVSPMTS